MLKLRKARLDEIGIISEIYALSWKAGYRGIVPQEYLDALTMDHSVASFTEKMQEGKTEFLIAYEAEAAVGAIGYGKSREEKYKGWGEIETLYLRPECQKRGVGTQLLEAALENLKKQGYQQVFLWALKENKDALRFYEKHGFTITDEENRWECCGTDVEGVRLEKRREPLEMIKSGELYSGSYPELFALQWKLNDIMFAFNQIRPSDRQRQQELLQELLGDMGKGCVVEPPVRMNWGCNTHLGENVYVNFNLTAVDDTDIWIGNDVMIGPNVTLATAGHPLEAALRKEGMQFNREIRIGDGAWLGAGVIVLPGVTIGARSVIGAGSVVTRDIPEDVVAFGNPCRVQKKI